MAKLYFRYGAMNSGKTTALMQVAHNYKERGMRVLILKPAIDTKGQDSIVSRLGICCKVDQLVTPEVDITELVRADEAAHGKIACVLCDESQFFTPEQADQLFLVTVDLGIPVICYGLRADFMMRGFPGSTRLLEIAHTIEELKTICACGRKAICNGRKVNGEFVFEGAQVAIDTVDNVEYQSLCPQCWYRESRAFLARPPHKKDIPHRFCPAAAHGGIFYALVLQSSALQNRCVLQRYKNCGSITPPCLRSAADAKSATILHRAYLDAILFAISHFSCRKPAFFAIIRVFRQVKIRALPAGSQNKPRSFF